MTSKALLASPPPLLVIAKAVSPFTVGRRLHAILFARILTPFLVTVLSLLSMMISSPLFASRSKAKNFPSRAIFKGLKIWLLTAICIRIGACMFPSPWQTIPELTVSIFLPSFTPSLKPQYTLSAPFCSFTSLLNSLASSASRVTLQLLPSPSIWSYSSVSYSIGVLIFASISRSLFCSSTTTKGKNSVVPHWSCKAKSLSSQSIALLAPTLVFVRITPLISIFLPLWKVGDSLTPCLPSILLLSSELLIFLRSA